MDDVRYADAGDDTHVAFRILDSTDAETSTDIVMVSGGLIPMDVFEQEPGFVRLLEGLSALGRLIIFDRRGIGLSDPIVDWGRPIVDQWGDDLAAVVDAAGVREPVVFAWDGYGVATRFAARHVTQLNVLVLFEPLGLPDDRWREWAEETLRAIQDNVRGRASTIEDVVPSRAADPGFRAWYDRAGRTGASPGTAVRIFESAFHSPPSEQNFEQIEVPTLVLHRGDNRISPPESARFVASQIPNATLVGLDGADFFPFVGDVDAVLAEIAAFIVGERRLPPPRRVLSAVMFTDLVGSTERAAALGDATWKSVLDRHDAAVRAAVGRSGGTVIKMTGDGVLATLPSAGVALRAAERVRDELAAYDLAVRIGIHVGDLDRRGDDVSGLAVNIAARVMSRAGPGEVMVTASVVAATAGQMVAFEAAGTHDLKGVPGAWELFRVADPGGVLSGARSPA